ncbi:PREDICTED: uncharacterized protein LOC101310453 [Fragaria vesca subsp. vesca]|uniref:uncharacterized protein LOC101310453 n=1 Tax=Fragaria vesca subsp. vesca TaxID=101020 RepID=UPI0002C354EA|nr:PREDICTED: uncharacterized protein LOC101310453 [Fragaria vesca subsp. vesca]
MYNYFRWFPDETKDPQNSRVMIFSIFKVSVRAIINALANIGNLVRATEFIGQSSGKILKGQSQIVHQAVLEVPMLLLPAFSKHLASANSKSTSEILCWWIQCYCCHINW